MPPKPRKLKPQSSTLFTFWNKSSVSEKSEDRNSREDAASPSVDVSLSEPEPETSVVDDLSESNETADNNNEPGLAKDVDQPTSEASARNEETAASASSKSATDHQSAGGSASIKRYKFQESWRVGRSWLRYDSAKHAMYCIVCRGFDKSKKQNAFREAKGCTSIRLGNVECHQNSDAHKVAVRAEQVAKTETKDRPLEKHLTKLDNTRCEKMKKYFKTSFYIAEYGKPFSDFKPLIQLQLHNFADSKIADQYTSYQSDKQCKNFIDFIAADLLEKEVTTKLDDDCFISILADGSTDRGSTELELIYISMLRDNSPVTQYVKLASVPKANAENIAKTLTDTLTDDLKLSDWRNNLVSCCFDGASVMIGCKSGVSTRLAKDAPHIIPIHCCAHRLELAIKNIDSPLITEVEDTVQECYKYYRWSNTNWEELQETAKILNMEVKRPVKLVGVRWLAHHYRAVEVVRHNWPAMVMHLNNVACSTAAEATLKKREAAMELLDKIRALTFVFMMNFLCAFLTIMKDMSEALQKNDITVDRVVDKMKSVKTGLKKLQAEKELSKTVDRDIQISSNDNDDDELDEVKVTIKYSGGETIGIKAQQRRETRTSSNQSESGQTSAEKVSEVKEQVKTAAQVIINETIQNIEDRFESFVSHKVIQAAYIINPKNWPTDADLLESYGDEQLEDIFAHYKPLLEARHVDLSIAKMQWSELKQYVRRSCQNQKAGDLWTSILCDEELADRFQQVLQVIRILLVLPVHTANVERGFSQVNVIKTEKRTRLQRESLSSLLTVKLSKLTFQDYDPMGAIVKWSPLDLPDKKRRRPDTKPYGKRKKVEHVPQGPSSGPQSQSDSEHELAQDDSNVVATGASFQTSPEDSDSDQESDIDIPSTSGGGGLAKLANAMIASDSAWESSDESDSEL